MGSIDLTRDVKDAKDSKDTSRLFADLDLLHGDKDAMRSKVAATNEANKDLIEQKVLPALTIVDDKGSEKICFGDRSVKFMEDGSRIEYTDERFPQNMTKVIRKDGSKTEIIWATETVVGAILNTDLFGRETKVEAKDGVKIDCDNATGKITTTNADGTKTVQRTDGVVESQDKDGNVVAYTDSAGRTLAISSSMRNKVEAAAGKISSALAQISDPLKARDCMDQLYAILGDLDPFLNAADPTVAASANSAHVQVTAAMCGAESRSNLEITARLN
jgi:archaellum component FlaG (FlaF/FlaG flagellin family)